MNTNHTPKLAIIALLIAVPIQSAQANCITHLQASADDYRFRSKAEYASATSPFSLVTGVYQGIRFAAKARKREKLSILLTQASYGSGERLQDFYEEYIKDHIPSALQSHDEPHQIAWVARILNRGNHEDLYCNDEIWSHERIAQQVLDQLRTQGIPAPETELQDRAVSSAHAKPGDSPVLPEWDLEAPCSKPQQISGQ